jgi:hypothetical protein
MPAEQALSPQTHRRRNGARAGDFAHMKTGAIPQSRICGGIASAKEKLDLLQISNTRKGNPPMRVGLSTDQGGSQR